MRVWRQRPPIIEKARRFFSNGGDYRVKFLEPRPIALAAGPERGQTCRQMWLLACHSSSRIFVHCVNGASVT